MFSMKLNKRLWLLALICLPAAGFAVKPMADGEVRDLIIRGSISDFPDVCPCPFNKDKSDHICGDNSEYIKSGGGIKCYHGDISDQEVREFRRENNIPAPSTPWAVHREEGS